MRKIAIIGGGLAGLISSIQLVRSGVPCTVIEKKSYPLHRVCGEYVSNEAVPFLRSAGLYPEQLNLPGIKFLEVSSARGVSTRIPLDLGGFGISRFTFDHFLYSIARKEGVSFMLNTEVSAVHYNNGEFELEGPFGKLVSDVVIGSFGKRSRLDLQQNRSFTRKRSPWMGVKYHVRVSHPDDVVSLHNFSGGYCGVCNVGDGVTNVCYLTHRDHLRQFKDIREMESRVLHQNPLIEKIFKEATPLFDRPEVINEISFETKQPVENHILMAGDAAGMIAPVCGNGMAIAIRSGKMLADLLVPFWRGEIDRRSLELQYTDAWDRAFRRRLWIGRNVQRLFGNKALSSFAVRLAGSSRAVSGMIVRETHGKPF